MQYWEEMDDKYGFSDGTCQPEGIEIYRDIYVKTVSRLAEHFESGFRVVPYDKFGIHNDCLWYFVSREWFETVYLPRQEAGQPWTTATEEDIRTAGSDFVDEADYMMVIAVELAKELGVDQQVEVQVKLSDGFEDFLNNCKQEVIRFQSV